MNSSTFSFRAIFTSRTRIVFLFVLFLIPVIEMWRPIPADPLRANKIMGERFWSYKTHHVGKYDIILLGDSRTYRGLSPATMEKFFPGDRIFNMGYSSLGFSHIVTVEAEKRLDEGSSHKAIILAITPYSLTSKAAVNEHFLQEKKRTREELWQRLYINPLYYWFRKGLHGQAVASEAPPAISYFQDFHDDGWIGSWTDPENPTKALVSYKRDFKSNRVHEEIISQLMNQIEKWTKQGIQVFVFRIPSTLAMERLENELSGFREGEFSKKVRVSGGEWLTFPRNGFRSYDGSHLHKESAIRLSEMLARRIWSKGFGKNK